ncbi:MAG: M23 family metallopeptidase [Leadbetterella sp.]|nr:M23 family metallopeptidase [Leadbetterella sp.]
MLFNTLLIACSVFCVKPESDTTFSFREHPHFFEKYRELLVNVRNYYVTPREAEHEFKAIMQELRRKFPNTLSPGEYIPLVFPLAGSNVSAVGGRKGNGYYVREFNLFDQSVSGSHPAHDIFIYDRNQDCIDDRRGEYVDVVSVGHGIVIAVEQNWQEGSIFRGGNYVWVYDLERGGLWYYAHNRESVVVAGQRVRPGDKLGQVGRTGFNAAQSRSDTHLHLMYLELDEDLYPHPVNYYEWLQDAETVYVPTKAEPYVPPRQLDFIPRKGAGDKKVSLRKTPPLRLPTR